ncbi:membrane protein [Pelistega indica]|uniref:Membrane protein n=1 Tax=Pelistega indica TaxID=1414851 RepID=V8G8E2_9BURK|nr:outer membrane protein assembly factor BamC [Pelistega indica]ETD72223.1 membrane protein [Pelistega indica]
MRMMTMKRIASVLLVGFSLSACSTIDDLMESEQVDYKSTVRGDPLTLPPDLSSAQINPQYSTHDGAASAAAYNQALAKSQKQRANGGVLPTDGEMQVLREGDKRWLQVNRDPNVVYRDVIAFWGNEGFTINRDNPAAGIVETDWAENRAKIPGGLLRRALGSIIDMVADSGERERFTTRLERVNGKTEVFISHERMVETSMDRDGTSFKWLPAEEQQELNAIMLSRLMAFMGAPKEKAREAVKATNSTASQKAYKADFVGNNVALGMNANQESAYRQVGQALSSAGFTIDSSDASKGDYIVRYLDTDTGEKRKSSNIISRLFGDKGNKIAVPYTINVTGEGAQSVISVRNAQGAVDQSETARRILSVLREKL